MVNEEFNFAGERRKSNLLKFLKKNLMKTLIQSIRLTLISAIVFVGLYSLIVWGIAQCTSSKGKGEIIAKKHFANIGQKFTKDEYFHGRPSAVDYNAAGAAGSNKGPTNPDYLKEVEARIDTFLVHNPTVKKQDVPADLVTASGSGLDPNISVQAAKVQVARIAKARKLSPKKVIKLIEQQTEKPLWNLVGTEKINVLKLNLALNKL